MTQNKTLKYRKMDKEKNISMVCNSQSHNTKNSLSMCLPSFKILAIIVPEKTVTQKNLTELRSYVITELRTDQIQYSPTFSKRGYKNITRCNLWNI